MTKTQFTTEIRRKTGTTSTTLTDAVLLPIVNFSKDEIASRIVERDAKANYFVVPATQDLVASSITAREYAWPEDVLNHIVTVECAFDSASPTVYVEARPYPGGITELAKNINGITEAKITANFTNEEPFYFIYRRSIFILSGTISAVTNGLKVRYRTFPADLADLSGSVDLGIDPSTTTFGIPKQFHELWARLVSIYWKTDRPNPLPLSPKEQAYESDLEKLLSGIFDNDLSDELLGSIPYDDGSQY